MSEIIPVSQDLAPAQQRALSAPVWSVPQNYSEAASMASMLAASSMVPKGYIGKPGDVMAAMLAGAALGFAPMQSLVAIAVVNGRPSLFGDALLAVVQRHPEYRGHTETTEGVGDARTATCTVMRGGVAHTATFSVADAKRAGLWGKAGPWTQYPDRMLCLRARGFSVRNGFSDALCGLASAEEVMDTEAVEVQATAAEMMPRARLPQAVVVQQQTKLQVAVDAVVAPAPVIVGSAVVEQAAQHVQPVGELLDIVNVISKTSKAGKQYHEISLSDGTVATTFSATVVAAAERARGEGMRVRVSLKTKDLNGRIFHNIDTMECVTEEAGSNEIPF